MSRRFVNESDEGVAVTQRKRVARSLIEPDEGTRARFHHRATNLVRGAHVVAPQRIDSHT